MILKKILQFVLHGTLKMFPRKPALAAQGGIWHSNRNIWQLNKRHNRLKLSYIIVSLLRWFFNSALPVSPIQMTDPPPPLSSATNITQAILHNFCKVGFFFSFFVTSQWGMFLQHGSVMEMVPTLNLFRMFPAVLKITHFTKSSMRKRCLKVY